MASGVGSHCALWEGGPKVLLNMLLQDGDVQSGLECTRRLRRAGGIGDGHRLACGWYMKKKGKLSRDRASAKEFSIPSMWVALRSKLNLAEMKCRHLISPITSGSLLVPELIMWTTASLSQRHSIVLLTHSAPHMATCDYNREKFFDCNVLIF